MSASFPETRRNNSRPENPRRACENESVRLTPAVRDALNSKADEAPVDFLQAPLRLSRTGPEAGFKANRADKSSSSVGRRKQWKTVTKLNGSNPDSR